MGNAFERFDRPMIVGRTDSIVNGINYSAYSKINIDYSQNKNYDLKSNDFEKTNYLCIDRFSDFVVDSNIRLTVNFKNFIVIYFF